MMIPDWKTMDAETRTAAIVPLPNNLEINSYSKSLLDAKGT